ncbi:putative sugar transporter [Xylariaceae sp. FL0804]|nr:putative sugar transporter [Xylariaceae sp. FL0804]
MEDTKARPKSSSGGSTMSSRSFSKTKSLTPFLMFSCFCMLAGDLLIGFDTGSFGGMLANPGFANSFGKFDDATQTWAFTTHQKSLMGSLAFIGEFLGSLVAAQSIERFGHREVFYLLSAVSFIGVVVELTASEEAAGTGRFAQFVVGRIVVYFAVGIVKVAITTYQAEVVPPRFRGLVVTSMQLFLSMGLLIASSANKGFSTDTGPGGWKTVVAAQFIYPGCIILFTLFIPDSPRWLLSKGREEDALNSLYRLRPKTFLTIADCENEMDKIKKGLNGKPQVGPWRDVVRGTNLRRTLLVMAFYFFQQTTGQTFISTYVTGFYKDNGYGEESFVYPVVNLSLGFLAVIPIMYIIDKLGRRWILMGSYFSQALWMYTFAGLGENQNRSVADSNMVVAALILFALSYNAGGASVPPLLGAEIPNAAVRAKTQALGAASSVGWAFLSTYVIPFIGLNFKLGWLFGTIAIVALATTYFFLPETKVSCCLETEPKKSCS